MSCPISGPNFTYFGIHCVQHRVGLVARFHAGTSVLMQHDRQPLVANRLGGFIEGADDIRLVGGKVVLGSFDLVRTEHKDATVVFLDKFGPGDCFVHLVFPLGGVGQVQRAVAGDER